MKGTETILEAESQMPEAGPLGLRNLHGGSLLVPVDTQKGDPAFSSMKQERLS